ncbi:ImmA/IrrE family metallo-endopeptidase [Candidatus Dependentiae bacterium]|nr:ImmA/IrrE family metallo-endopeptidase [Candidatus Dependentiae bacterium]
MEERFEILLGEKIKNERLRLKLSLEELSKRIGFNNYQTLLQIEKGKRKKISMLELVKIAKALFLSVDNLINLNKEENHVLWRECTDFQKAVEFENQLKKFCSYYKELDYILDTNVEPYLPLSEGLINKLNYRNDYFDFSKNLADFIHKEYNLGDYPAFTLVEVLKERNILVFFFELGNVGSAASYLGDFGGAIILNKQNKPWRRSFDIGHELFHLLTWNHFSIAPDTKQIPERIETYANIFASNLLLPENSILNRLKKFGKIINSIQILHLSLNYKVSLEAMCWRLKNLGVIDDLLFNQTKDDPNLKKMYQHLFNDKYKEFSKMVPDQYFLKCINAYTEGRISKAKMGKYLMLNLIEVNKLFKELNIN